jgi:hypothetical protein
LAGLVDDRALSELLLAVDRPLSLAVLPPPFSNPNWNGFQGVGPVPAKTWEL